MDYTEDINVTVEQPANIEYSVSQPDTIEYTVTGALGPKGDTGAIGATGPTGPQGPQGNPTTVNGKTGASITLTASDVGAAAASHTHTESDVTNLTTDLAAKQATLVSGTNIKTINGTSLLGSGNITISGTGDVVGPASSVNGHVVTFSGTTGKLVQDSGLTLSGTNTGDQDLSGLVPKTTTVNSKALSANITLTNTDVGAAATSHTHGVTDLTATGTPSSSTFLRGDNTWSVPAGAGDVAGPASSVDSHVVFFNGTTGKLIKDSGLTLSGTNTGDQTSVSGNAGTATALQTPRAIYGNNFDGTAALTQIIASTYGGTGNGFTKFTGPTTAEKTFTLPNASATVLTDNAAVTVAQGGTGATTLTGILKGNGTSAVTAVTAPAGTIVGTTDTQALTNKDLSSSTNTFGEYQKWLPGDLKATTRRTADTGWLMCFGQAVSRSTYASLFAAIAPSVGTFTVTIASPAVVTLNSHGFLTADTVYLTTTGALPTGLSANTIYYVIYIDANTFKLATSNANALAGTAINTSGSQSGTHTLYACPYGLGDGSTTFNVPDCRGRVLAGADAMGGTGANRMTQQNTEGVGARMGNSGGEQSHTLSTTETPAHSHLGFYKSFAAGTGTSQFPATDINTSSTVTGSRITDSVGGGGAHNNVQPTIVTNWMIKI